MKTSSVTFGEISWTDRTFEIRGARDYGPLFESLARFGIMDPPWLVRRAHGYTIVDGFKRLAWARENGIADATVALLPEDFSNREIWERRIGKKLFEGGLNPAEKTRVAAVALGLGPFESVPEIFRTALNIAWKSRLLERWAALASLGDEVLEALGSGQIAERAALEFSTWGSESTPAVVALLKVLRCSSSIQVEIVERTAEIAIRGEISPLDVLGNPELQTIISDKDTNHRQKTQMVRNLLARLRFPTLSRREEKFERDVKSLSLPPTVRIVPPPSFEGDAWRMELSFSSAEELRSTVNTAGNLVREEGIGRIFDSGEERH